MNVVIVESPAKAKTINKYLGKDYEVLRLVRPRPRPARQGRLGRSGRRFRHALGGRRQVGQAAHRHRQGGQGRRHGDPGDRPRPRGRGDLLARSRNPAAASKPLEGQAGRAGGLQRRHQGRRARCDEHPREIDAALVDAYLARRALDYLVGFTLSPVLWRKLPGARSAGRVQSVALRLVCDRELEIENFVAREYWSIVAHLADRSDGAPFTPGSSAPTARRSTGSTSASADEAAAFKAALEKARFSRRLGRGEAGQAPSLSRRSRPRPCSRRPPASSASRQRAPCRSPSGFMRASTSAARRSASSPICAPTASIWRPRRSPRARKRHRQRIRRATTCRARRANTRPRARTRRKRTRRSARPTWTGCRSMSHASSSRSSAKLYELIWTRTLASQMESGGTRAHDGRDRGGGRRAQDRSARHRSGGALRRLSRALPGRPRRRGGRRDPAGFPPMSEGDALKRDKIEATQHFTEPPPRFTEATLVKRMEELGIGRPSTYASTLAVLARSRLRAHRQEASRSPRTRAAS